jgi:hypothetical protein
MFETLTADALRALGISSLVWSAVHGTVLINGNMEGTAGMVTIPA